jgi:hypothetical protein
VLIIVFKFPLKLTECRQLRPLCDLLSLVRT